jgi:hypothetical protein
MRRDHRSFLWSGAARATITLAALVGVSAAGKRGLTAAEARSLIAASLGPNVTRRPHFGLDAMKNAAPPQFYAFEASAESPGSEDSPIIGSFAVDRDTGSVWQLVVCREIHSVALTRLQDTIRRRIGITSAELKELAARAPCSP